MLGQEITADLIEPTFLYSGKKRRIYAWCNWLMGIAAVLLQFSLQMSSGVVIDQVGKNFSLSAFDVGLLSGSFYYAYVVLQIPSGMLVDKYGARRLISLGGVICAFGCWCFATSEYLLQAEVGRLIMGIGSSMFFVSSIYLIQQWFKASQFAMMIGLTETVGLCGTILGDVYFSKIVSVWGWRYSMDIAAIAILVIAGVCAVFMRDKPYIPAEHIAEPTNAIQRGIHDVICSKQAWLNGIYSGLLYSVVTVFVALWGVSFFVEKYQLSYTVATAVNTMVFAGGAIGCPFIGWYSERIGNRRIILIVGALAASLLTTTCIFMTLPLPLLFVCMFLLGIACGVYVLNFAIIADIIPKRSLSTGVGFTNALCIASAPIFQPMIGLFLMLSAGAQSSATHHYTTLEYQHALSFLPLVLLFAAYIAYRMKEPYTDKVLIADL